MTGRHIRTPAPCVWRIALCIVFLAGLALRLFGLDWDDGADLHPDELFIAKIVLIDRIHISWPPDLERLLDPARSGLNPRSADPATGRFREFAYGALPLWVTDAAAAGLTRITGTNWNAMDHAYLVGRSISATLSALTILPIAAIGMLAGGRSVSLLAALFAALAPMSIQLAHFFTTDSWLTFFVALALLACVRAARDGGPGRFALAGAAFGLAMACKGSVFTLAIPIAAATAISASRHDTAQSAGQTVRGVVLNASASVAATVAAFLVFEPYALLQPDVYIRSLRTQADIVSGAFDVPFTRVYAGTVPVLYQMEQFVRWGYGPVAGILALLGIVLLVVIAARQRSTAALILLSWALPYTAVLFVADVKFLRYLEPLAPVFAVAAAIATVTLVATVRVRWTPASRALLPAIVLLTAAWTGAFTSIYAHENSRMAATKWIYAAVPPGSALTAEYWDDALPRTLSYAFSPAAFGFGAILLDLYLDLPPGEASDAIYEAISRADYIVQSSERVEAAMAAAPWRYPVQDRYFDQLERGNLGFDLAANFARVPTIGGIAFDDRRADESFINYDHPRVAIYERDGPSVRADYDRAMAWALQRPWQPARAPSEPTLLLDHPVGVNPSVNDARWSAEVTSATPMALVAWLFLLVVLAVVGWPIARAALPHLPDAGWGLARTLAVIVAAYPVWLGASLHLFRFRAIWVIAALIVLGVAGWRFTWAHPRRTLRALFKPRPGPWLHAEGAFWLVFLLFLAFRFVNPDGWHPLWGGEKPMEFAQINAIGRSAYFPPYDPWFADGYVNYYYYGFYLIAFLLKATGIPSEIGLNLALPTVMALLASGGFSVGSAVSRALTRSPRVTVAGGWATVVAVCLMGNLSATRGIFAAGASRLDPFIYWTWSGSRAIDNAITEFPFFTGLYGDLHAHVVALPLTVLVIGLSFATATDRVMLSGQTAAWGKRRFVVAATRVTLIALTLGSLGATNAWDVPVYAILAIAASFMATAGLRPWTHRGAVFAAMAAAIGGGAWLLFLPFYRHFVPLFSQIALVRDPTDPMQFLTHLGGLIAVCSIGLTTLLLAEREARPRGVPWPLIAMVIFMAGLSVITWSTGPLSELLGEILLLLGLAGPPLVAVWARADRPGGTAPIWSWSSRVGIAMLAVASVACVLADRAVLGLLLALGGAAAGGWILLHRPGASYVCLLLSAGFLTAGGTEIVVVADDLIGTVAYRMNTVFKFYNQVWILLSISAACLVAYMAGQLWTSRKMTHPSGVSSPAKLSWARAGLVTAGVVLLASLAYPVLATGPRLAQRFEPDPPLGTLNALAWMQTGTVPVIGGDGDGQLDFQGDASAIAWLQQNVSGTPVIAEASIGPYRCNGTRISNATGLPTIIGWERHQQQQRYPESLPARVADVRTLYTSANTAEKADILYRYNVEFVIVGDLERVYPIANNECTPSGSAPGIAAFDEMLGETLEVVHDEQGTTIYRVLPIRGDT